MQRTFCYCTCGNELCKSSFVSDTGEGPDNIVLYKCSKCGSESKFNFDIAPVPIKV